MRTEYAMKEKEAERAWDLLKKTAAEYKPEWKDGILEHARIVHDASLFLARLFPGTAHVDFDILTLGAILHDVGRSRASRIVEHGVKSGEIIREHGFPEAAARIGETHIGVGIAKEETAALGLPHRDFIPESLEERIVCYVDNLLFYIPGEDRHELRDTDAVVKRFTRELGESYGRRSREFMEKIEHEVGPRGFKQFQKYINEFNRELAGRSGKNRGKE